MNYKCLSLLACSLIAAGASFAQKSQKLNIGHITVFLSGAEIESDTRVEVPQGTSEILLTNVAGNLNAQSISVGADNNVVIQSATPKNDYLSEQNLSPKARQLADSLDYLKIRLGEINNKKATVDEQISVIRSNRNTGGANSGLNVTELQKMLDLIALRMNNLLNESNALQRNIDKTNERIALLDKQYNEELQKGFQPGGQLLVKLYSPVATTTALHVTYITPNAGWTPVYDLKAAKINDPLQLVYKANIVQQSGISWDKVKLTLSTGNPNEGLTAPDMQPWFLSFYVPKPVMYKNMMAAAPLNSSMRAKSDEVAEGSLGEYVSVNNSGVNTRFDIALTYTILSDGKEYSVAIQDFQVPATYRYYTAPKLDPDVFLQARITNWEEMNLIPGNANIFYEGTYVGQQYLDPATVKDTLNLSLGRDKKVIVHRTEDKNYRSQKMIGSNVRRSFQYTIEIRNTRKDNIDLLVSDQFPVSNDKDIEVIDTEAPGASIGENGIINWELQLKPAETKTLKLQYAIKYPRDKRIMGL
ncbi:MAG: mucoidy inhibitor MuiA family protein [Chitinophagaceae bacterium]